MRPTLSTINQPSTEAAVQPVSLSVVRTVLTPCAPPRAAELRHTSDRDGTIRSLEGGCDASIRSDRPCLGTPRAPRLVDRTHRHRAKRGVTAWRLLLASASKIADRPQICRGSMVSKPAAYRAA